MPTLSPPSVRARHELLPFTWNAGNRRDPFNQALPFLLGSLILCTATLTGQVNGSILLIFLGCAVWRLLAERREWALPSMVVRTAIFLPSVGLVALLYGVQPSAGSLLAFLIVLLALKVLELRNARDFTVVALLGYFMVLSGLFYDQSFALCLYLFVAVLLNTVALIRVHLGPAPRAFWPVMRLAFGLLLQAAPLVVLLFIIFPRVQVSFMRRLTNGNNGTTGISDHLQPGSIESLAQTDETAFRARIKSREKLPPAELYWRGVVLSRSEGDMSWRPGSSPAMPPKFNLRTAASLWWSVRCLLVPPRGPSESGIEQAITAIPQGERWLFALDRPTRIQAESSIKPLFSENNQLVNSAQPLQSKVNYTVFSEPAQPTPFDLSLETRKYYTAVPTDVTPRVMALVRGWLKADAEPLAVIRAAGTFFRDNEFSYTLTPGSLPHGRALEYFLFESRRGFCEHYAAAFCSLMRAAGLPSRIVVGYQGGELNSWNDYYTIRQSDAHAWCEVWLGGRGWQRVDPTGLVAPGRVNLGAESFATLADNGFNLNPSSGRFGRLDSIGWVHWVRRNTAMLWESVDQQWNLMVIGYDPDVQFAFMQNAGLGNLTLVAGVALAIAGTFSILILGAAVMRLLQGFPTWRRRSSEEAAQAAYDRFRRRLANAAGVQRKASEGPLDFAARATSRRPDLAAEIESITARYVNLRYTLGNVATAKSALAGLIAAIHTFRPAALRRKPHA